MFQTLASQIHVDIKKDVTSALGLEAATFDWTRLGTFTGSTVAEYAQTSGDRNYVSRVPKNAGAADRANNPITFTLEDVTFYKPQQCWSHPEEICEIHIHFRNNKSMRNCVTRKFRCSAHAWFCLVNAALSILARGITLGITPNDLLRVYRSSRRKEPYNYLQSYQVISIMRTACIEVYPDKNHYM
jgi:hypothetical protein